MKALFLIVFFVTLHLCYSVIEVPQDSFKVFRQKHKKSQKNHIKLRFKTIHATGLLMFAQGPNKKDFLSVELYRGKIRVAADYGRGTENRLRPIAGFYDMYLGKDLADNEWHTVEVVRNIRESMIFIDRGTPNEKKNFMKSPPTYNELTVSTVTFGGYYTFAASELDSSKAFSRKGIQACFSEAFFSQTWPAVNDADKVDFMRNDIPAVGTINTGCPETNPQYKPIFFPSSSVHIALMGNYSINSMKIELKFRTVISEQVLANYTGKVGGNMITFGIDRKGRIELKVDIPAEEVIGKANKQVVQTAKENYHDGEWHEASFYLENTPDAENKYIGQFTVDKKTRLFQLSKKLTFFGTVNVGFGFTGCMRDIKINDDPIERVRVNPPNNEPVFKFYDMGVVYNSCSLKDYCNPNPCQNGAKCNQTEDNVMCDCHDTLYEGSTCHRPRFNYTCAGVRKSGERRSDVYYIDFDGMGPMEPVQALCDLEKTIEATTTQINNTKMLDQDVSTTSGTNDVDINYGASITQMRELVLNSAYCVQYIKYACKGAPLFRSPEGPPATSWMGGDDILHYYWGGAKGQRGYCACGIDRTCVRAGKYCNCDSLDPYGGNIFDEGNLTVKEHLPVRQVKFTSVLKSDQLEGYLRVGHLRCSGFGSHRISATFREPYSFLSVDHPDQPFDNIFAGELAFDFKTSVAYNYMVMAHAHGPFSGDYAKVMIWSRTMVRVHLNFGFGDIKQDVDIAGTGRYLDDNDWHEFSMMFNMKELNVTLDGIMMIQGLRLQEDPVQFNVDDKPVYIGGSFHDPYGFVGCIRSLYVNGRIHDIRSIAQGQEDYGVYPGCGSACVLLNRPCNYGACIDEYNDFKCNCTVSPNDGKYCQNESYPRAFASGQSITLDFEKMNQSKPIAVALFVVGFKTSDPDGNVALAQLEGENKRHFTLALVGGYLTLFYTQKEKKISPAGSSLRIDDETLILRIMDRKLNNGEHNVARVHFSTEEIFLSVPNYELVVGANVTERPLDVRNPFSPKIQDVFKRPLKFTVGAAVDLQINSRGLAKPTNPFTGCMSGAKFVYTPHATAGDRYPKAIAFDMFKLLENQELINEVLTGTFPAKAETQCGDLLPTPGTLPTVGPARQFFTRSPGLDNSVRVTKIDALNRVVLFFVIVIVSVVILGFLYLIYRYVNRSHVEYRRIRKSEKPKNGPTQGPSGKYKKLQSQPSFNPGAQSNPAPVVIQSSKPQQSQDDDNFFL